MLFHRPNSGCCPKVYRQCWSVFFHVAPIFDLTPEFYGGNAKEFVSRFFNIYGTFLLERRKSCETHYVDINKTNRLARAQQGVSA